jgi:AraC-like DNA-binding protein
MGGQGFDVYHLLLHPKYLEKNSSALLTLPAFSSLFRVDPLLREKNAGGLHLKLSKAEIKALAPHLDALVSLENKSDTVTTIISDSEAMIVIAVLCSLYEQKTPSNAPATDDTGFADSLAYLYGHYSEAVTIDTLCRIAKMSRTAYLTKFKRVTGTTPASLQNAYRIEIAKSLLTETNAPVSEISATVGCYDTSHLIRLFKNKTGSTPSRFRKEN